MLVIKSEPIRPEDNRDFFDRFNDKEPFEIMAALEEPDEDSIDGVFHPQPIHAILLQIVLTKRGLQMTFYITGKMPPRLHNGLHTMVFHDGHCCDRIPASLYRPQKSH
ncbi:hypothetical protein C0580_00795 [Candidatus Parcubacteria bacterium]|nr:MAG: hypothetical protein C0580_00795 [Candidatus Parcubacteria bacterium]